MASASVRAYQGGPETLPARRRIVQDYLNSVPLSAAPGHGEVHGLADGLRVWFGADFERSNRLLGQPQDEPGGLAERGLALREAVALMIAQRRPSHYLGRGRDELEALTDSHLRLLTGAGVLQPALRDAALGARLAFRDLAQDPALARVDGNKGISLARTRLSSLLQMPLYDLDRLDLGARTSLQGELQQAVTTYLHDLAEPAFAQQAGLLGERMLTAEKTRDVRYSFTLFERTPAGNQVRVQTDNTDQPFDINEGSKLELGSTAKLRVLATYLDFVARLHQRYAGLDTKALREVNVDPQDVLSRWALDYLASHPDARLAPMLDAALERTYSASPAERFFTGGGMHTFGNFRREDNGRTPTLREALRESINLPFVRLLRDLVRHAIYRPDGDKAALLRDDRDPRRQGYLDLFVSRESQTYLLRFWNKYKGKDADARMATFLDGLNPGPPGWRRSTATCSPRPTAPPSPPSCARGCPAKPSATSAWRSCTTATGRAPSTSTTRATSPACTRWSCGCWPTCRATRRRASARRWRPVARYAARSTAGCSSPSARTPGTRASAPCWRWRPSSTSTSTGASSATRSTTWCRRWPPHWAAPATARRPWRS